ncbi:MAG: hypothetical protein ACRD0J_14040, partial [Acidimicrobiales bacterium]
VRPFDPRIGSETQENPGQTAYSQAGRRWRGVGRDFICLIVLWILDLTRIVASGAKHGPGIECQPCHRRAPAFNAVRNRS